jgi:UDP-2-acetamido-3-amino-2,3-dideoxy-glucuronate N-acetyltransferase
VLKLRELLGAKALGKVNYIYSNRLNFGKIRTEENALWSFAPHDLAVILRLVGEMPIQVTCVGGSYVTPNLADVTVSCLHFRTGLRAHVFHLN